MTVDLGCGDGAYLAHLKNKTDFLVGLDLSRLRLRRAKRIHKDLVLADVSRLCFRDDTLDAVVLVDVLEHLMSVEETLAEVNRILKVKGKVYITVPNKFVFRLSRFIDERLFGHHETTDTHYSEMTYKEVKRVASKEFCVKKIEGRLGSKWPDFLSRLRFFPYLTPNLMVLCEKMDYFRNYNGQK